MDEFAKKRETPPQGGDNEDGNGGADGPMKHHRKRLV